MFEYFPNNYPWSLAVMSALNRGGQVSEVDDACRPLKEIAAKKNDPSAQDAWFQSWMKLAERVERLGDIDAQANHPLSAGRKYMRAGLYYLLAERMPSHKTGSESAPNSSAANGMETYSSRRGEVMARI